MPRPGANLSPRLAQTAIVLARTRGANCAPARCVASERDPDMPGGPAASIPAGWTADGLPIGLQIVGGHLADQLVLRASRAYEQASPWQHRRPPV